MRKILTFLLGMVMLTGLLAGCGGASGADGGQKVEQGSNQGSIEEIKKRGVVRIGVFSDKPPFGYVDANGKKSGI